MNENDATVEGETLSSVLMTMLFLISLGSMLVFALGAAARY